MRAILSDTTLRKLHIIEHLDYSTRPIPEKVLAEKLKLSLRTLQLDVEQINIDYHPLLHIHKANSELRLDYHSGKTIRAVYQYLLKNELGFILLDRNFRYGYASQQHAAVDLKTSRSTIYRLIQKINPRLSKYHIQIGSPNLAFIGEEIDIRFFFAQFFSESTQFGEWPFETIDQAALKEMIIFAYSLVDDKLSYPTLRFLLFSVGVNLIRLRQGYRIPVQTTALDSMYHDFIQQPTLVKRMEQLADQLDFELTLDNIKQLFIAYTGETFQAPKLRDQQSQSEVDTIRYSTKQWSAIIHSLADKYQVPIEDEAELTNHLHNTAHLFKWETETFNILYPYVTSFLMRSQYYVGDFIQDAYQLIRKYIQLLDLDSSKLLLDLLVYTLITHWSKLVPHLYATRSPQIHCAVISDMDPKHAEFVADILSLNKRPYVHFHAYTSRNVDKFYLDNSDFDLIVTTFSMTPLSNKPLCSIHRFPTEKDLYLIDRSIYELLNIE